MIKRAMIALCVFLVLFLYTYEHLQILKIGYDLTSKEKVLKDLNQESMELLIKNARLKSPNRIETISREKLGLVVSKPSKIIYLKAPKVGALSVSKPQNVAKETETRGQNLVSRFLPRFLEHLLEDAQKEVEAEILIQ